MTGVRDFFVAITLLAGSPGLSEAGDWIFDSGPYTRSATTGKRIPFQQFFSEDGPHPFGMDWWYGDPYWNGGGYSGFDYGLSPEAWGGYPYGRPYIYPLGVP
jgi:hypothetical protein